MVILAVAGWIIVGVLMGLVVSKLINLRGDDPRLGMAAAGAGALVGGILHRIVSGQILTAFNPWSVLSAAIGAAVALIVWHLVRSRFVSHDTYVPRQSY